MIQPTIKLKRAGEPGTLGAVCKAYFGKPNHEDCPFWCVCPIDNGPVEANAALRIIYNADAKTLEAMAEAIRATEKEEQNVKESL
jgi:hypothetical protein